MIRLIGDIHGNTKQYLDYIKNADESIQLGDFGFGKSHRTHLRHVDSDSHKILFGNHDDTTFLRKEHSLGDYGTHTTKDGQDIFFIRGAACTTYDKAMRVEGRDWRANEELSIEEGNKAVAAYKKARPKVVISHDAPTFMLKKYLSHHVELTRTDQILQACWEFHKPEIRIHGHHHMRVEHLEKSTIFICLDAYVPRDPSKTHADYLDLDIKKKQYTFRNGKTNDY